LKEWALVSFGAGRTAVDFVQANRFKGDVLFQKGERTLQDAALLGFVVGLT